MKAAASALQDSFSDRAIDIGETVYVCVHANKYWNRSGINVGWGERYTFVVPRGEHWTDGRRVCGAEGYCSVGMVRRLEGFRRIPNARWLQLVGAVGKSSESVVIIGQGVTDLLSLSSGRLYFFANDLPGMYWNNKGLIALRVTRTK